jgi:hypothetical protein
LGYINLGHFYQIKRLLLVPQPKIPKISQISLLSGTMVPTKKWFADSESGQKTVLGTC